MAPVNSVVKPTRTGLTSVTRSIAGSVMASANAALVRPEPQRAGERRRPFGEPDVRL